MRFKQVSLQGTTSAGGAATLYPGDNTSVPGSASIFGRLYAVEWIDGDLADGVDGTLSVTNRASGVDRTLLTLTNANDDAFYYPREQVHGNTGGALTYDGTRILEDLPLIDGLLKLVIASGGNAKTGGMIVTVIV